MRAAVLVVVLVVLSLAPAPEAAACIGPEELQRVEATIPSDGAAGVSLSPTLLIQLGPESGYPGDTGLFGGFSGPTPVLTLTTADGELVESVEVELLADAEPTGRTVVAHATTLQPDTLYFATLEQHTRHEWSFTTGDGEVEPFAPAPVFEIDLDAYFGDKPVYSCCPQEFVGECPRCFLIGHDPLPTISSGFELLPHPDGPGAFIYTLQQRDNAAGSAWSDVATGAFDDSRGSLRIEDGGLVNDDVCFRVLARSVVEPTMEYESNEGCRNGSDHFTDPPQSDYDHSGVMCGDPDPDVEDPDMDVPNDPEPDAGTDDDPDDEGWRLGEDGMAKTSDSGCGCASVGPKGLPGSLLLLVGLVMLRRRLRP